MPLDRRQLLADPHFRLLVFAGITAVCAIFGMPENKQQSVVVLVGGIFAFASVWTAGTHYVAGKTVEGTVPPGSQAADKLTIQIGQAAEAAPDFLHHAADYLQESEPELSDKLKAVAERLATAANTAASTIQTATATTGVAMPPKATAVEAIDPSLLLQDPPAPAGPKGIPSVTTSLLLGMALILLSIIASGCGLSAPFKAGASNWLIDASAEQTAYLQADTAIDPATKASELADSATIASLATDPTSLQPIYAAWARVEGPYLKYVDADADLDADAKQLRHESAAEFDKLIHDESTRPFGQTTRPTSNP